MDTRFLESFVAAVDHHSMAEAARRLGLTAAGLAQRIRAVEAECGMQLVRRAGRTVVPTEAGLAVLPIMRNMLREVAELRAVAGGNMPVGELRIGATPTAVAGMLPPVLHALIKRHPRMSIRVIQGKSVDHYHHVLQGELDACIGVKPPFTLPKTCQWQPLRREGLLLLTIEPIGDRHPHDVLATEPFIRFERNHWGGHLAEVYLRHFAIRPQERFELDALDTIAVMVDRGLGVSLVPDWMPPWPEGLKIVKTPMSEEVGVREIGMVWLRESPRRRLIQTFLEEALKFTSTMPKRNQPLGSA